MMLKKFIRRIGRVRLKRKLEMDTAKDYYFKTYGMSGYAPCQACAQFMPRHNGCDAHHKIKRSESGTEATENLLLLCRRCHAFIHEPGHRYRVDAARIATANMLNGECIQIPEVKP